MSLVRYDPWSLLDQLRREMDRAYEGREESGISTASDWVPAVDIKEEPDCFLIRADVPGVDPKAIEVHAENGMLTIKGERESEKKEEKEGYKRVERVYGSFFRRFSLPDTADTDKITAKSNNGVLEVRVPKHERVQPRKITVEG
ncbi:Hsp20/alpha crystallin family protein [Sulfurivermis fontis]|uniref:Hsp20/alpha crystallin family protein n=1 Tax=Sulfurivermis fontis TaxID=1972068 RepID=UPI000FDAADBB|nr:Hsp20/alpha crystallin family protein [Sulfurivermis fontis]